MRFAHRNVRFRERIDVQRLLRELHIRFEIVPILCNRRTRIRGSVGRRFRDG
jgi:hypothetical protein